MSYTGQLGVSPIILLCPPSVSANRSSCVSNFVDNNEEMNFLASLKTEVQKLNVHRLWTDAVWKYWSYTVESRSLSAALCPVLFASRGCWLQADGTKPKWQLRHSGRGDGEIFNRKRLSGVCVQTTTSLIGWSTGKSRKRPPSIW